MLLPYSTDTLMPPSESLELAKAWNSERTKEFRVQQMHEDGLFQSVPGDRRGLPHSAPDTRVHCEVLETHLGHDAFLAEPTVRLLIARCSLVPGFHL